MLQFANAKLGLFPFAKRWTTGSLPASVPHFVLVRREVWPTPRSLPACPPICMLLSLVMAMHMQPLLTWGQLGDYVGPTDQKEY